QILHFNYFIYNSIVIYSAPLFEYYARNDKYSLKDNLLYHVFLGQFLKLIPKNI
ncbi:hypothetical protein LCGC14_2979380, partial [marine sediment metagenome]